MEFDKNKYKVWKLPNPMLLHWIINPALAINELILGQRVPKMTLVDKTSDAPLMERQSVPCPHCNALNDSRLWSKGNTFGHWFGLICPKCHGKIPCLWNLTSLFILAITFPIWIWIKIFGEEKWLAREKRRIAEVAASGLPEAKKVNWLKMGVGYGVLMFCFMTLPKILKNELPPDVIAFHAGVWLLSGLVFGFVMKLLLTSKR